MSTTNHAPTLPSGARMTVVAGIEPARKPLDLGRELALFANNAKLAPAFRREAQRLAVAVDAELIRLETVNAALGAALEGLLPHARARLSKASLGAPETWRDINADVERADAALKAMKEQK